MLDPFCGSGSVLAAAAHVGGMDAIGLEISPKKSRHAAVLQLYRADDGSLVAQRSTDLRPTGGMAQAPVDTDAYAAEAATGAAE